MHGFVRQHGLADDVADGEDVGHVGAHLDVDGDEAAVGDGDTGFVGSDLFAVGRAAHSLQHQVTDTTKLTTVQLWHAGLQKPILFSFLN